jgi:hypothetical protein
MVYKLNYDNSGEDVSRIMEAALHYGVVLSPQEAEKAWDEYSESMAAGWMMLPETKEEIWNCLPMWARGEEEN